MTLSDETQETQLVTSQFANRLHGPRPPFLSMRIEVALGVQSPAFPLVRIDGGRLRGTRCARVAECVVMRRDRALRGNKKAR